MRALRTLASARTLLLAILVVLSAACSGGSPTDPGTLGVTQLTFGFAESTLVVKNYRGKRPEVHAFTKNGADGSVKRTLVLKYTGGKTDAGRKILETDPWVVGEHGLGPLPDTIGLRFYHWGVDSQGNGVYVSIIPSSRIRDYEAWITCTRGSIVHTLKLRPKDIGFNYAFRVAVRPECTMSAIPE